MIFSHIGSEDNHANVLTKPLSTERAPLLDKFGVAMAKNTIKAVAREWDLTIEDTFDRMLIVLWDALFLGAIRRLESARLSKHHRGRDIGAGPLVPARSDGGCKAVVRWHMQLLWDTPPRRHQQALVVAPQVHGASSKL